MTPFETAQLQVAREAAAAAARSADAAWFQAWAAPLGIAVGLLGTVLVPIVSRRAEKHRLHGVVVNMAAKAEGISRILLRVLAEPAFVGRDVAEDMDRELDAAIAELESIPRASLGDGALDAALQVLILRVRSVRVLTPGIREAVKTGFIDLQLAAATKSSIEEVREQVALATRLAGRRYPSQEGDD